MFGEGVNEQEKRGLLKRGNDDVDKERRRVGSGRRMNKRSETVGVYVNGERERGYVILEGE
jgi:hypothetical protein